jgi:hypothetical protein
MRGIHWSSRPQVSSPTAAGNPKGNCCSWSPSMDRESREIMGSLLPKTWWLWFLHVFTCFSYGISME